jgi:membrane associated rhomboid family serine protease
MIGAIMFLVLGVTLTIIGYLYDLSAPAAIGGLIVGIALFGIHETAHKEPTAMDVYQGKTTLEITYRDGIPIDSVVVFKDK